MTDTTTDDDGDSREDAQLNSLDATPTRTWDTEGRVIRPFFEALGHIGDEVRVQAYGDGALSARFMDAARVQLLEIDLHADAFDSVSGHDGATTFAVHIPLLTSRLRKVARKGKRTSDDARLGLEDVNGPLMVEAWRDYDGTVLRQQARQALIDPDSVPKATARPNVDLSVGTDWFSPDAFAQAVDVAIGKSGEHVSVTTHGDDLVFTRTGDTGEALAALTDTVVSHAETAPEDSPAETIYSASYLDMAANVVQTILADRVKVAFAEEFPMEIDFERGPRDALIASGTLFLAPRIQSTVDQ